MNRRFPIRVGWSRVAGLICLALIGAHLRATELYGIARLRTVDGNPMEGVKVSAEIHIPPVLTDSEGKFTLTFPSANYSAGQTVRISIERTGYVIINNLYLNVVLRNDPRNNPVILPLCPEGEEETLSVESIRQKMLSLLTLAPKIAALEQSIREIDASLKETNKKLTENNPSESAVKTLQGQSASLAEKKHEAEAALVAATAKEDLVRRNINQIAESLANEHAPRLGPAGEAAMSWILAGDYPKAIEQLDSKVLEAQRKSAKFDAEKLAADWILRAQLLNIEDADWLVVEDAIDRAVEIAPGSFYAQLSRAKIFFARSAPNKARKAYENAIGLARKNHMDAELADALAQMGALFTQTDENVELAAKPADEAIELCRRNLAIDPHAYSPTMATALAVKARVLESQGKIPEAITSIRESVMIWRRLAKEKPEPHVRSLALILERTEEIYGESGQWDKAIEVTRERLQLYDRSPPYAAWEIWEDRWNAALKILEILFAVNDLTAASTELDTLLAKLENKATLDAMTVYYEPEALVSLYDALAQCCVLAKRPTEAIALYSQAINFIEPFQAKSPDYLLLFLQKRGDLEFDLGRWSEAQNTYTQWQKTYRSLPADHILTEVLSDQVPRIEARIVSLKSKK